MKEEDRQVHGRHSMRPGGRRVRAKNPRNRE